MPVRRTVCAQAALELQWHACASAAQALQRKASTTIDQRLKFATLRRPEEYLSQVPTHGGGTAAPMSTLR